MSGCYSTLELKHLNAVRLHLQVASISDIATADGQFITVRGLQGLPSNCRKSRFQWPRQPLTTTYQRMLWTRALQNHLTLASTSALQDFSCASRRLRIKLLDWQSVPNQTWPMYYDPDSMSVFRIRSHTQQQAWQHTKHVESGERWSMRYKGTSVLVKLSQTMVECAVPAEGVWSSDYSMLVVSCGVHKRCASAPEVVDMDSYISGRLIANGF